MRFARSHLIPLCFLLLLIRAGLDKIYTSSALSAVFMVIAGVAITLFFLKSLKEKRDLLLAGLWCLITALAVASLIQSFWLRSVPDRRFQAKADQVTGQVKKRIQNQLSSLQDLMHNVQLQIQQVEIMNPQNIFVQLQDQLRDSGNEWALYAEDGVMLAWNGQFPEIETPVPSGSEEITVYTARHQHFLRLKTTFILKQISFIVVVQKSIAADYGIHNRYLKNFNLLKDGLSLSPDLSYNSDVTPRPGAVVKIIKVTPDFWISALFWENQFQGFLGKQSFQIHWWFEFITVLFFLTGLLIVLFDFLGKCSVETSVQKLYPEWCLLLLSSAMVPASISRFSAFGIPALNTPGADTFFWNWIGSPGGLLITSFVALTSAISLALMVSRVSSQVFSNIARFKSIFLFLMLTLSALFLGSYFQFLSSFIHAPADPIDHSLISVSFSKISQILGILWLDLSFLISLAVLVGIGMQPLKRSRKVFLLTVTLQIAVAVVLYTLFRETINVPIFAPLLLFFGSGILLYFMPDLSPRFRRLNLFSKFLVVLMTITISSFVNHFARFHFADKVQKEHIQRVATQVQDQDKFMQDLLESSKRQIDEAIARQSMDPKISDLAFRLWRQTDLARYGLKSAIEIYDEQGRRLLSFSLNVPSLRVSILDAVLEGRWGGERRLLRMGNERKPVYFLVRDIPEVGYVVMQAVQDYESLPFLAPSNPFQELFRAGSDPGNPVTPELNIYDSRWQPLFVSRPELSLSTLEGQDLLRESREGWVRQSWGDRAYDLFYFKTGSEGNAALIVPATTMRHHVVHLMDLFLINLMWIAVISLLLVTFFRRDLLLYFPDQSTSGLNFFQKMLVAFVVFSMVPILSFSALMRNYTWETQREEVISRAVNSFSVASQMVVDYLLLRAGEEEVSGSEFFFSLTEWISQFVKQDVSVFYRDEILASSNIGLYAAGLLQEKMAGRTHVDLFLKGQKYSINEAEIGQFRFLTVSGRIHNGRRYLDQVITIPFLIDERKVEGEITELREYMILVGVGLVVLSAFLGYFLAGRFSKPVRVLIKGTSEMSRGNLQYRIREIYQDEFHQLVSSFNAMAASLDEQQATLERRRAYIENIINNITTAVVSLDHTSSIATYNPAAVQLFRLPPAFRGSVEQLVPEGAGWAAVSDTLRAILSDRSRFQLQEVALRRANLELHLRMVYVPLFTDGNWNGAILLVEDITDIIRSNRLSAWAEMARRVAHEVKNPLTPIQLSMEHLLKVYSDHSTNFGQALKECSDVILKQVKTLRRLVSDFSQYGRPAVLNKSETDVAALIDEITSHYRFPKGIEVDLAIESELPGIQIDAEKIRSAVMNVIENGLQAMNGVGTITVRVRKGNGTNVEIQIQDTGHGIPSDILPRLFEPYFSTKNGGTGLGLAIARKNIEDHGGSVQVESIEGHGTTVTISLPAGG